MGLYKALEDSVWLTQLGWSMLRPLLLCLGGCWWAVSRWGWPMWVYLPAVLLGLAAGAQNFWVFVKERLDRSKKAKANGPRTIDLDLLWMDGETHGGKKLRLPHPLIGERDFVLVPLEDLMHDPARGFRYNGVEVKEPEDRVGHIVGELGRM